MVRRSSFFLTSDSVVHLRSFVQCPLFVLSCFDLFCSVLLCIIGVIASLPYPESSCTILSSVLSCHHLAVYMLYPSIRSHRSRPTWAVGTGQWERLTSPQRRWARAGVGDRGGGDACRTAGAPELWPDLTGDNLFGELRPDCEGRQLREPRKNSTGAGATPRARRTASGRQGLGQPVEYRPEPDGGVQTRTSR